MFAIALKFVLQSSTILQKYAFFLMQKYLTNTWGLSFTHAAAIVNIWNGARKILPVFWLFIADTCLGNFVVVMISVIADCLGMALIAMSTPPALADVSNMCKQYSPECIGESHKVLFYTGLALVALGLAGYKATLNKFLEEQGYSSSGDSDWCMSKFLGVPLRILAIALPSIRHWAICFGVIAIFSALGMIIFMSGSCSSWIKKKAKGSSLISTVCIVCVASCFKMFQSVRPDRKELHQEDNSSRSQDNSAIEISEQENEEEKKSWKHCSQEQVKTARQFQYMLPVWGSFLVCGIVFSIGDTYFVEQASTMDRKTRNWNVPLPVILLLTEFTRYLYKGVVAKHFQKNEYLFAGIILSKIPTVLCCITAAKVEERRLSVARSHGLLDQPNEVVPMKAVELLNQFALLGLVDSQLPVLAKINEHVGDHDEATVKYFELISEAVLGVGSFLSVLSVYVVGLVSARGGNPSWFQLTLNRSRLDKYYWVLAVLSSANLVVFLPFIYRIIILYHQIMKKIREEE